MNFFVEEPSMAPEKTVLSQIVIGELGRTSGMFFAWFKNYKSMGLTFIGTIVLVEVNISIFCYSVDIMIYL